MTKPSQCPACTELAEHNARLSQLAAAVAHSQADRDLRRIAFHTIPKAAPAEPSSQ